MPPIVNKISDTKCQEQLLESMPDWAIRLEAKLKAEAKRLEEILYHPHDAHREEEMRKLFNWM
jgi:hypothetical protein